jgi:photosystem II stability/assembly factor-like uncharacterized protein
MRIIKIVLILLLVNHQIFAQKEIKLLTEQKGVSLRGMSIPSENVIWASGSKGNVVRSINGGESFEWMQVKGYENRDFRAIHAWDEKEALIVAIASPAIILKTFDGGMHWEKVYENNDTSMFLDAVSFKDKKLGMVVGDPINDTLFLLTTHDKGDHWSKVNNDYWKSKMIEGEAFFASSNSNLVHDFQHTFFVTGGLKSRLWINGSAINIPMIQGSKSTGANSIAISPNQDQLVIVGGDFTKPNEINKNFVKLKRFKYPNTTNKHLSQSTYYWKIDKNTSNVKGYKSSIVFINNKTMITAGTSGVEISKDTGKSWELISNQSFHVVQRQPNKKAVFLAGSGGRIGYVSLE